MANWNDRRGQRSHGPDDPRDDIHQGPWSPYSGRARDREHYRYRDDDIDARVWGDRGRDYWIEDDRWDERQLEMGDQRRHRDDDQEFEELEQQWGNRMGLREEPIERGVPRAGSWQREPRYREMERMWSDRDDHPWSNERRPTEQERREHRDYARTMGSDREHRDDYARERGGEQYPAHLRGRNEQPRHWTERQGRGPEGYHDERHEQRLRAGREDQRIRDEERFGHQEPPWMQRRHERGPDDRFQRGGEMHARDDRDMHGREPYNRDMQRRSEMRGRDDREMYGRDQPGRYDRDRQQRDDRDLRDREMPGRDMRGRDDRGFDPRHRDDQRRDMQRRDDMRGPSDRSFDQRHRDDQRRDEHGGPRRGGRNRYD
jgi:hypothetical protein